MVIWINFTVFSEDCGTCSSNEKGFSRFFFFLQGKLQTFALYKSTESVLPLHIDIFRYLFLCFSIVFISEIWLTKFYTGESFWISFYKLFQSCLMSCFTKYRQGGIINSFMLSSAFLLKQLFHGYRQDMSMLNMGEGFSR